MYKYVVCTDNINTKVRYPRTFHVINAKTCGAYDSSFDTIIFNKLPSQVLPPSHLSSRLDACKVTPSTFAVWIDLGISGR